MSGFTYDIDRMKKAVDSPNAKIPHGLSHEHMRQFIANHPITPEMLKQQRIGVVSSETGMPWERVEQILKDNGSI